MPTAETETGCRGRRRSDHRRSACGPSSRTAQNPKISNASPRSFPNSAHAAEGDREEPRQSCCAQRARTLHQRHPRLRLRLQPRHPSMRRQQAAERRIRLPAGRRACRQRDLPRLAKPAARHAARHEGAGHRLRSLRRRSQRSAASGAGRHQRARQHSRRAARLRLRAGRRHRQSAAAVPVRPRA